MPRIHPHVPNIAGTESAPVRHPLGPGLVSATPAGTTGNGRHVAQSDYIRCLPDYRALAVSQLVPRRPASPALVGDADIRCRLVQCRLHTGGAPGGGCPRHFAVLSIAFVDCDSGARVAGRIGLGAGGAGTGQRFVWRHAGVVVTRCWVSESKRSASFAGDPIRNWPGTIQRRR